MMRKYKRYFFADMLRKVANDVERGEKGSIKRRLHMAKINHPRYDDEWNAIYSFIFKKTPPRVSKDNVFQKRQLVLD